MEEPTTNNIKFQWGRKSGISGVKKDTQFYESFTKGEESYTLFDCVYLYVTDMPEPNVGKILRIWEQRDGERKVEILWFFHPSEILNYLRGHILSEKEMFLGSGKGVGLTNINPLEAIAGKCAVVCTSEDVRNSQASEDALETADFIFYRTFDVGKQTISDKFPDNIAGVEVKNLFNRKKDQVTHSSVKDGTNGFHSKRKTYVGEASGLVAHHVVDKVNLAKHKAELGISEDQPSKNFKLSNILKTSGNLQNSKNVTGAKKLPPTHDEVNSDRYSTCVDNEISEKMKLSEKKINPSDESLQKILPVNLINKITDAERQIPELTRRPDVDRSKWFKGLSWGVRLDRANEQGKLVFLENLDLSLTSTDIQDIMYHTFKQYCIVKVIPSFPPYHNPHYGQAYAIFKTQDAANDATQTINRGCLMQPNGSAFIASIGMLPKPPEATQFPGHIVIRTKQMQREESKKAIYTSHCSQPNTIEYEMAMDWILMQETADNSFVRLYKMQGDEIEQASKVPEEG